MRGILKKDTVEEARQIDILSLQSSGVFSKGPNMKWNCTWSRDGEVQAAIGYSLVYSSEMGNPNALRFEYRWTPVGGEPEDADYFVSISTTPCHYGGLRYWFICPLSYKGKPCGRRCRILYLADGSKYLGCRECHQLTYESRQLHRNHCYETLIRPMKEIEKLEKKLSRVRSLKKQERLLEKFSKMSRSVEKFKQSNF